MTQLQKQIYYFYPETGMSPCKNFRLALYYFRNNLET